jgi:hypothetical protein
MEDGMSVNRVEGKGPGGWITAGSMEKDKAHGRRQGADGGAGKRTGRMDNDRLDGWMEEDTADRSGQAGWKKIGRRYKKIARKSPSVQTRRPNHLEW